LGKKRTTALRQPPTSHYKSDENHENMYRDHKFSTAGPKQKIYADTVKSYLVSNANKYKHKNGVKVSQCT